MQRLFLLLFIALLLIGCKAMKEPEFRGVENVKVGKLGFGESAVTLDMRYFNPNSFKGKLKSAEGEAWIDSTYLGGFVVDSAVAVPAKSEFTVPVKMNVDMKRILKNSLSAFLKEEVTITIKGNAKAGTGGLYKNFPLNYSGRQKLAEVLK
jgi:LEA14-like dessication related protein